MPLKADKKLTYRKDVITVPSLTSREVLQRACQDNYKGSMMAFFGNEDMTFVEKKKHALYSNVDIVKAQVHAPYLKSLLKELHIPFEKIAGKIEVSTRSALGQLNMFLNKPQPLYTKEIAKLNDEGILLTLILTQYKADFFGLTETESDKKDIIDLQKGDNVGRAFMRNGTPLTAKELTRLSKKGGILIDGEKIIPREDGIIELTPDLCHRILKPNLYKQAPFLLPKSRKEFFENFTEEAELESNQQFMPAKKMVITQTREKLTINSPHCLLLRTGHPPVDSGSIQDANCIETESLFPNFPDDYYYEGSSQVIHGNARIIYGTVGNGTSTNNKIQLEIVYVGYGKFRITDARFPGDVYPAYVI